jgi:diaminopimelate epimerase
MRFIKFHGFGNDYIVFEAEQLVDVTSFGELALRVCNRHYGAGADGIAVISQAENERADFTVRIFNPDGTEARLSGNGTRSAAAYLYYSKLWERDELRLATLSGVKLYRLHERIGDGHYWFEAELGKPRFDSASIPMLTIKPMERVVGYEIEIHGSKLHVTALQMGNPHCCIFVRHFHDLNWRSIGRALQSHAQFPEKTNVVFVRVVDRKNIELRIWERGVGETLSSGTGACAATVASIVNEKTERRINVEMPGGCIEVEWRADNEVVMTGRADIVYCGDWIADVVSDTGSV